MGWFDSITQSLSGVIGKTGTSIVGGIVSTALTGYVLNRVTKSLNSPNANTTSDSKVTDYGQLIQIPPSQNNRIPVLYGTSTLAGIITEAVQTNNNATMTYVITISEKTGELLSDNSDSQYTFNSIYWNNQRIVFNSDGITAHYTTDRDGNVDRNIDGLVKVRCYVGSNTTPQQIAPQGYSITATSAYTNVPGWDSSMKMNNLIFAIVEVNYNRDRGITGLPNMTFNITNSMSKPGDVLYDYMINSRYGAAIQNGEIYSQ